MVKWSSLEINRKPIYDYIIIKLKEKVVAYFYLLHGIIPVGRVNVSLGAHQESLEKLCKTAEESSKSLN